MKESPHASPAPSPPEPVEPGASLEQVGADFGFTEGPVWSSVDNCLLFSDISGDTRYRFSDERGVEIDLRGTNKANGLAFDHAGRLLSCEHATSLVVRYEEGARTVLASHHGGLELNSPNDIVVSRSGSVYFTDPPYGRGNTPHGLFRSQELGFQGVFRLDPDATDGFGPTVLLADDFAKPNGLCFDLDEALLYVNDTERMHIRRFDVLAGGDLAGGDVFFELDGDPATGFPDGMKLDEHGNVWVCGPGGIWIVSADGVRLGVIETPEIAANLAFGGDDRRTLFITANTGLYRIRTAVAGAPSSVGVGS